MAGILPSPYPLWTLNWLEFFYFIYIFFLLCNTDEGREVKCHSQKCKPDATKLLLYDCFLFNGQADQHPHYTIVIFQYTTSPFVQYVWLSHQNVKWNRENAGGFDTNLCLSEIWPSQGSTHLLWTCRCPLAVGVSSPSRNSNWDSIWLNVFNVFIHHLPSLSFLFCPSPVHPPDWLPHL